MIDAPLVDTTYLTIRAPWTTPPLFLGLEAVVIGGGIATLVHALRARRRGDAAPLVAWACIFVYGIAIELLSYNAFPNFVHGQFSVMFYHQKLPLYVTTVYPVFLYASHEAAKRLGMRPLATSIATGALVVALDMPFDILGPRVGWWWWSAVDPNVKTRWLGVPVTSYYWHLTWGAIVVTLARLAAVKPAGFSLGKRLALSLPIAVATIALGRVAFLPFDALCPLGVSQGAITAAAIALAAALVAAAPKLGRPSSPDAIVLAVPAAFYAYHLLVAGVVGERETYGAIAAATAIGLLVHARAQRGASREGSVAVG